MTETGTGTCSAWSDSCDLQTALSLAYSGDEIWVKAGTYKPDLSDRAISFNLKNGVSIYGGFAGTETQLSQRNPASNATILSGDIGTGGDSSDNSYHVVVGSNTDNTAVLDGFTITGGNANGDTYTGGGMLIQNGSPTLKNITFKNNSASAGGGMFVSNSQSAISHTTFTENSAPGDGGGAMYLASSNLNLTNVTISNNTAAGSGYGGGGILINNSSPSLVNVTIANNINGGFSYYGGTPTFINTIIANNTGGDCFNTGPLSGSSINNLISDASNACGLIHGTNGNIVGVDPLLGALANNGGFTQTHATAPASPAVDAGDNTTCADANTVNNLDQRGMSRPVDSDANGSAICDIGAFEHQRTKVTLTLKSAAAQDGWILESTETSNKGGQLNAGASTMNIGDDAADKQYRAILSFNTTLPSGAVITKATLKFKYAGKTGTSPFSTHGKLLVDVKKGAFSNNPALAKGDFNVAGNKSALFSLGSSTNWFTKVFSASQFTYINKAGVTQFRLRFTKDDNDDLGADFLKIYSGSAGSNAPQLIVEYYVP